MTTSFTVECTLGRERHNGFFHSVKTAIALIPELVLKNLSGTNFNAFGARRVKGRMPLIKTRIG